MSISSRWVKVLAVAPGIVVSWLLAVMVVPLLPPPWFAASVAVWLAVLVALGCGGGESLAVRAMFRVRRLDEFETSRLAPVLTVLSGRGLGPPVMQLWVQPTTPWVSTRGVGRRSVIVSAGLVQAVIDGRIPTNQAAALLGHSACVIRSGDTRRDVAIAFSMLPYTALRGVASLVVRLFGGMALVGAAWALRFIVGGVAVAQSVAQGHPWFALLTGSIVTASYLVPRWERAWAPRMDRDGDDLLVAHGLGPDLAQYLRSRTQDRRTMIRVDRLLGGPASQSPRLVIVR